MHKIAKAAVSQPSNLHNRVSLRAVVKCVTFDTILASRCASHRAEREREKHASGPKFLKDEAADHKLFDQHKMLTLTSERFMICSHK